MSEDKPLYYTTKTGAWSESAAQETLKAFSKALNEQVQYVVQKKSRTRAYYKHVMTDQALNHSMSPDELVGDVIAMGIESLYQTHRVDLTTILVRSERNVATRETTYIISAEMDDVSDDVSGVQQKLFADETEPEEEVVDDRPWWEKNK